MEQKIPMTVHERQTMLRPSPRNRFAVLAVAAGALALGAVAIGALAIGSVAIGRMRIRRLEVDELIVHRLRRTNGEKS